jgi:hypothetical protein
MNKRYDQLTRFDVAGLVTGTILALIAAMTISIVFDVQPADASVRSTAARTATSARV